MKRFLITVIILSSLIVSCSAISQDVFAQPRYTFDKIFNVQTITQQQGTNDGNTGSPNCTLPVPIPKLLSPPDVTVMTTDSPLVFQWSPIDDPCGFKYILQVGNNPDLNISSEPVPSWKTNNVPSYTMTPPTYHTLDVGDHYWRVYVEDDKGNLGTPSSSFKYTIQASSTPNTKTVLIVNGVAKATLPSGVTSGVTFLNPQTGTVTFEKTTIKSKLSSDGTEIKFIGDIAEIHPNGASCSSGCIVSFEFNQNMIPPGINSKDLKIFHDKNNDGDFADPGETLDTTITQMEENVFKASATAFFNSKFAVGGIAIIPTLATLAIQNQTLEPVHNATLEPVQNQTLGVQNQTSVPEFPDVWVGAITTLMIGITIVLTRQKQFRI